MFPLGSRCTETAGISIIAPQRSAAHGHRAGKVDVTSIAVRAWERLDYSGAGGGSGISAAFANVPRTSTVVNHFCYVGNRWLTASITKAARQFRCLVRASPVDVREIVGLMGHLTVSERPIISFRYNR